MKYPFIIALLISVFLIGGVVAASEISHAAAKSGRITKKEASIMNGTIKDKTYVKKDGIGVIYLAGGCFWGLEKLMESLPGVTDAVSGYANGNPQIIPNYELVCRGTSGYKETVRVEYREDKISLETILFSFFNAIDTTAKDRQGNDRGSQYQSGVYTADNKSAQIAARVAQVEKKRSYGFAVEIEPLTVFHEAEDYHQDYLKKNPRGYCHISNAEINEAASVVVDAAPYKPMTEEEMRAKLTPMQYKVTQKAATEPPFENEFWDKEDSGLYVDITTGEPLFSSKDKYRGSCGWPSFTKPLDENTVRYLEDSTFGMTRTEVRSRAGNAHLGHVFEGDPQSPNGVRFCINSASLKFIPYEKMDAAGYGKYKKYVK